MTENTDWYELPDSEIHPSGKYRALPIEPRIHD